MEPQVPNPEQQPQVTTPVNRRHAVLKELAQAHNERMGQVEQSTEFEPAPKVESPKTEQDQLVASQQEIAPEESKADQPKTQDGKFATKEVQQQPDEQPVTTQAAQPEMVTVKVDGEVMQVPKSEIEPYGSVARYQIEKASEKRFQKIGEQTKVLTSLIEHLSRSQQQPQSQPQQQSVPNQDELLAKIGEQITYGDDTQRAAAIKQLVAMAQPQTHHINATVQQQVMYALNVQKLNEAENQFVNRNKDLLMDAEGQPRLSVVDAAKARVDRMKQQIVQTGQFPANPDEFFKLLEVDMRKEFGKPVVSTDISARNEKKAAIAEPKAASGRVPSPTAPKQLTVSEQIDQMRKARGQKQLYH